MTTATASEPKTIISHEILAMDPATRLLEASQQSRAIREQETVKNNISLRDGILYLGGVATILILLKNHQFVEASPLIVTLLASTIPPSIKGAEIFANYLRLSKLDDVLDRLDACSANSESVGSQISVLMKGGDKLEAKNLAAKTLENQKSFRSQKSRIHELVENPDTAPQVYGPSTIPYPEANLDLAITTIRAEVGLNEAVAHGLGLDTKWLDHPNAREALVTEINRQSGQSSTSLWFDQDGNAIPAIRNMYEDFKYSTALGGYESDKVNQVKTEAALLIALAQGKEAACQSQATQLATEGKTSPGDLYLARLESVIPLDTIIKNIKDGQLISIPPQNAQ